MKGHQEGLPHLFDPRRSWVRSDSFVRSLILSTVVGLLVAWVGIAMFALSRYLHVPWTMAAAAGGAGQVVIVSSLLMIVLEQRRKRLIRHGQELTFLNHHIWNAITQLTMVSSLTDPDKQQRIRSEAVERISGALRRVANSANLTGLSLDADLTGVELIRQGGDGEEVAAKRTA